MSTRSDVSPKPARRRSWRRLFLLFVLVLTLLWLVHPPLLSRLFRFSLGEVASRAGLTLEVGNIQANLAHPLLFENLSLRAREGSNLRTAAKIKQVKVVLNWPWQAFWGPRRIIHSVSVEGLNGVFDFRRSVLPSKEAPEPAEDQDRDRGTVSYQLMPEAVSLRGGNMEFIAAGQSLYFGDVDAEFNEDHLGHFTAAAAEIHTASFNESLGSLKAFTGLKEGTVYMGGIDVREGIRIENLEAHFGQPGGVALVFRGSLYGGAVRADVSFWNDRGALAVDSAVSASNVQAAPLARLLGVPGKLDGRLREGRLTFRGIPGQLLDGEISMRLVADGFRWNERGWESLTIGGSMIHRRLAVSEFVLNQKDNSLTASGEVTLGENWADLAKAPFQLNLNGSVNDLGALAGLVGQPFQDLTGRMSLSSSLNGRLGKLDGFLILEASGMKYRRHPVESGRLDVTFAGNEAQVNQCEFWSGVDYVRGKGSIQLSAPYTYAGDVQGRTDDIASYLALLAASPTTVYAGKADLRWQGDGTLTSHSGAFNVALDKFVSARTPSGLTGRFAGTYSPQNIYFSGFELQQGPLLFSTQATLASSGIKFTNALLRSGKNEVASGEMYLPVDPFALLAGRKLGEALDLQKSLYASVTSRASVNLRDLFRLGGNDLPAEGTVNLDVKASGSFSQLAVDGKLEARGVGLRLENSQNLRSNFAASLHMQDGTADASGTVDTRGFSPITLKAQGPFSLFKSDDGALHFARADAPISGQLEVPSSNLEVLRPLMPGFRRLSGVVSGTLSAAGTVAKPIFTGTLAVSDGVYEPLPQLPVVTGLAGVLTVDGTSANIEKLAGSMGDGPVELKGGVSFAEFENWHYDFALTGSNVQLSRDPALSLRADVDFTGSGNSATGSLKGHILLGESRIDKRLNVTPLLSSRTTATALHPPPAFPHWIPAPFQKWTVDVAINSQVPTLLGDGDQAGGELTASLNLGGVLGHPVPVGRIDLKNVRAFLPFTALSIPEGHLDFNEANPWVPQVDIRGTAQALDFTVQAYAFGPLSERRIILRSEPPLPQDSLVALLNTGILPSTYTRTGLGGITPSTAGPSLTQPFGRQLALQTVSPAALLNRPPAETESPSLSRFQLWQDLSLMRDGNGFGNSSLTYSLTLH